LEDRTARTFALKTSAGLDTPSGLAEIVLVDALDLVARSYAYTDVVLDHELGQLGAAPSMRMMRLEMRPANSRAGAANDDVVTNTPLVAPNPSRDPANFCRSWRPAPRLVSWERQNTLGLRSPPMAFSNSSRAA
jgi:hypothetical protein